MKRPTVALTVALAAVVALLCGGTVVLPVMMFGQAQAEAACGLGPVPTGSPVPGVGDWTSQQVTHAATIVSVGRQRDLPARAYVIALATAMQEATLRNLASAKVPESLRYPNDGVAPGDHDSVGLFQQRPNWGSVQQRMTPTYSAGKFYAALAEVDGWERMRLTDAAQAVQRSGLPEAYQKWEEAAEQLAAHVLGLPDIDVIGGGAPTAPCGVDDLGPVPVGPGGWVQPIRAPVGSGFGPRGGRLHAGVDMSKAEIRGDAIRAASTGVVERVVCDSSTGTCDRDGGRNVRGCGWFVDIRHAGRIVTRYCHMIRRPEVSAGQSVQAGQVIGFVGSSGHSSGPHLHYEVHVNVPAGVGNVSGRNAVDPVPFMRRVAAPLGQ